MSTQDRSYDDLPTHLKDLIDAAFNSTISSDEYDESESPRKKRKTDHNNNVGEHIIPRDIEPGGFIIDDTNTSAGFLPHSPSPPTPSDTIPLSLIPSALARLNLATDDEDVLAVFRTAASGWSKPQSHTVSQSRSPSAQQEQEEGTVSRKDFRAVCAVLLEAEADSSPSHTATTSFSALPIPEGGGFIIEPDEDEDEREVSDTYQDPSDFDSDLEDDESADEYVDAPSRRGKLSSRSISRAVSGKSKSKGKGRGPISELDDSDEDSTTHARTLQTPTQHQKHAARLAFALFFPPDLDSNLSTAAEDDDNDKLDQRRLTVQDITRVAELLKEKISLEETKEMLAQFSTCPDGSMSLADFERMTVVAGLV